MVFTKIRKSKIDRKRRNFKGKLIVTSQFTTEITLRTFCEIDDCSQEEWPETLQNKELSSLLESEDYISPLTG